MNKPTTGVPGNRKSRNELFDDWGAWLVVFGLALEIVLAILSDDLTPSQARWGTVFATALIAVGVWMEIHFGGIVRAEANARAVEAEARAVDAKLELERLKALNAPRVLTSDQRQKLQELAEQISEIVVMSISDAECAMLASQIAQEFRGMRILVLTPMPIPKVAAGLFAVFPEAMNPFEKKSNHKLLVEAGITAVMPRSWLPTDERPDSIVIVVGQKPLAYETPLTPT